MIYGYLRVSTDKQDTDNQKFEILTYANDQNMGQVQLVSETVSGKVSWNDRQLGQLVGKMSAGDTLIVTELSRLGRSFMEVFELVSILLRNKIEVHVVKDKHVLKDDIHTKVLTFAMTLAGEIERDLISQRMKEALARRKSEGVVLGRPVGSKSSKLDGNLNEILALRKKGVSIASLSKIYSVGTTTMRHFLITREII